MITTTANGYNSINNNGDDGDSNDNNNADDNNNNNSNDNDNHKDNNVNKSNNNNDAYNKAELLGTACNPGSVEGMGLRVTRGHKQQHLHHNSHNKHSAFVHAPTMSAELPRPLPPVIVNYVCCDVFTESFSIFPAAELKGPLSQRQ